MSVLIVIPARYASVRYPGKPLVPLRGSTGLAKTLVQRSWEAAQNVQSADRVVIATDDDRIRDAAQAFGAEVVMTSPDCKNGTERCAEAIENLGGGYDVVVNFQGDAPLTPPWFVEELIAALLARDDVAMVTPVLRCDGNALRRLKEDRANGRVGGTTAIFDATGRAMYFSKEVIPFTSKAYSDEAQTPVFHHVGVYAFRPPALATYQTWPVGRLESLEGLEQLRFIENGHRVQCVEVEARGKKFWELNNPEDVPKLERMMAEMEIE